MRIKEHKVELTDEQIIIIKTTLQDGVALARMDVDGGGIRRLGAEERLGRAEDAYHAFCHSCKKIGC